MTQTSGVQLPKLEDDPLWREASALAEYMYERLSELPDVEQWGATSKLRHTALDLMFYTAQAVGNATPTGTEYDWGNVRKYACSLQTMYRFACRQKFLNLEPSVMVRLDAFIAGIDERVTAAYAQTKARNEAEYLRWRTMAASPAHGGDDA